MKIQQLFQDDINRKINGVVKVNQDSTDILVQELDEYVITRDLKKHFKTFLTNYKNALYQPNADTGVWISGFFGSGKSHFLKMLSYLLANREVGGIRTADRFRGKFADDPATAALVDAVTSGHTDTILFNIDIEGSIYKDKTAVLRVFAKMFYNYLGFYGEDLKVAKLEQYVESRGKTAEFRAAFAERYGADWLESRATYAFLEDEIVYAMHAALGMTEESARGWFARNDKVELSISSLVGEMHDYVAGRGEDFALLFMIDEVGQYVGADTDLLINLQSLLEEIGRVCDGRVWVACTGQEAIDDIIRTRENEFSRIQARFATRLSLTSASVDEVIEKRILSKTPDAAALLTNLYSENDSVLRNLFTFSTDTRRDIKGYTSAEGFTACYPFVPYQFIILQQVFAEIRRHGNSGKHLSGGERSMLSGFQEAAQALQDRDEYALAPFHLFYNTVHTFLDSSIRRVIERAERAADSGDGLEPCDVDVLKLLYLIRYIKDIPANLDNLVILMADDIRIDKVTMREQLRGSLGRLLTQNYIGRTGDTYSFLTDEEQDIQRGIYRNTQVDTAAIVDRIGTMIFADIYATKKFRYGKYDFPFDQMVDTVTIGAVTGGMRLHILTVATDQTARDPLTLLAQSKGEALVVLADTPYYESLESALKVRKYVKQRNVAQEPLQVQAIIRSHQDEASRSEQNALAELRRAIERANYYVDGEHIEVKGDACSCLDAALAHLVGSVYSRLSLVTKNADTDADILAILAGGDELFAGYEANRAAADYVADYLELQDRKRLPTSMADVQSRYQAAPYGWREVDIAAVVAMLIVEQKVTIKYGGATIQPSDSRLPELLRKKTAIHKVNIAKRQVVSLQRLRTARTLLNEYTDIMSIPEDEDGLVQFIITELTERRAHYESLNARYATHPNYPERAKVTAAITILSDILSQQKDNIALIGRLLAREDDLLDSREGLTRVEDFFTAQVQLYDEATALLASLDSDLAHIDNDPDTKQALDTIRMITMVRPDFQYHRIPELNQLMRTVHTGHDRMLAKKRGEIGELIAEILGAIHRAADGDPRAAAIVREADAYYTGKKQKIAGLNNITLIDGESAQLFGYQDRTIKEIKAILAPRPPKPVTPPAPATPATPSTNPATPAPQPKPKKIKRVYRQVIFGAAELTTEADIDEYLATVRKNLVFQLKGLDGLKLD